MFFADRARYEKRSSTAKGLLFGAFFFVEDPLSKNTFGKIIKKLTEAIINLGSVSQDEGLVYKQRCGMPKLNSFGSDEAKK